MAIESFRPTFERKESIFFRAYLINRVTIKSRAYYDTRNEGKNVAAASNIILKSAEGSAELSWQRLGKKEKGEVRPKAET
jgi:hypothetical protein